MAVYTRITENDLKDCLSRFDLGALESFEGIADGVENTNYRITTDRGRYILTLFEKRVNPEELPFYLSFMTHLRDAGIACPAAAADKAGNPVFTIAGKTAIITGFLDGQWPKDGITAAHCAAVGNVLARMHNAAATFYNTRRNSMALPAWRALIHATAGEADTLENNLFAALDAELDFLEKNWPRHLPHGAVHADLFPDNVFFNGTALSGIIDFYFACTDLFVYDLMLTLNPWCFDKDGRLDIGKSAALLAAYHAERPLRAAELEALPLMGRAAALRIIATRMYDWFNPAKDAVVTPKDPREHIRIWRYHQSVSGVADYGWTP